MIIYEIYKKEISYDCWGKSETEYTPTGKLFKSYQDALKNVGEGKIVERELR